MDYTEGEYITGEYTGDDEDWSVTLEYDGGYDLMNCSWDGHPHGCTQKRFDTIMREFSEKYFNYPGDDVQGAFEALAEKEGWE